MTREITTISPPTSDECTSRPEESHLFRVEESRGKANSKEYLEVLLQQESTLYPLPFNYLTVGIGKANATISNDGPLSGDAISESWRRKLCEWCFEVVDYFKFDREVVSIALNYLDRSVAQLSLAQAEQAISKKEYQLLVVTSLYMAIKVHGETDDIDGPRRKLKIDAFYELSRQQFEVHDIEVTERRLLGILNWKVNPPTSLKFIATLIKLCPSWQGATTANSHSQTNVLGGIYDVARYLTELSVCQSDFSFSFKTSTVAYAALLCGIEALHSTLPLPYLVRVSFLNNIFEATGLVAGDADVVRICSSIRKLCPEMLGLAKTNNGLPSNLFGADVTPQKGTQSPICVVDDIHQAKHQEPQNAIDSASCRKRSRCADNRSPIRQN
jgi:Cyclin, N-terminal domain